MDLLRATIAKVHELADRHNLRVHYAVKANSNERILREISAKGFGADCVSGNEVLHAHECGFPADRIVYAGVGKSDKEICNAMRLGIEAFNCESLQEIFVINEMAREYGVVANVSVRINPDIDAHTHKYVTTGLYENKFGISQHEFDKLIELIGKSRNINFSGVCMFVYGSSQSVAFTGDVRLDQAKNMYDQELNLGQNRERHILISPHHGGDYSASHRVYSQPLSEVIISVGRNNTYGHPEPHMLSYLENLSGNNVKRTDAVGDILERL